MFYIAIPRSRMVGTKEFGIWDLVQDNDGYVEFDTFEQAKQFVGNEGLDFQKVFIVTVAG